MLDINGMRCPIDVILTCIRWYVAYSLSYRHVEDMMKERGVNVDHSSISRWAIRFLPLQAKSVPKKQTPGRPQLAMDETYIKVKGVRNYLYRAVDKAGNTIDFLLAAKRDKAAVMRFFDKTMRDNGVPEKIVMDKSDANKAAIDQII